MSVVTKKLENGERATIQSFNRFGTPKMIIFHPDSGQELSMLARLFSGQVLRMTREEYMELEDYNPNT